MGLDYRIKKAHHMRYDATHSRLYLRGYVAFGVYFKAFITERGLIEPFWCCFLNGGGAS